MNIKTPIGFSEINILYGIRIVFVGQSMLEVNQFNYLKYLPAFMSLQGDKFWKAMNTWQNIIYPISQVKLKVSYIEQTQ